MIFLRTYGFVFLIFFTFNSTAQENFKNEEERIKYANKLFEDQKFIEAETHMSNFLSNQNNSEYNFKYGVCVLFKYADKSKSIPYLKKAIKDPNVDARAYFYLGRVYHYNYLFQDALNYYNKYKSIANSKQAKFLKLEMYIKMSQNGQSLMKNLSDIIVVDKKSTSVEKFNYSYDLKDIGGKILVTEEFQTKIDKKKNHKSIIYFPPLNQDILFYSSYGEDGDNGLDIYFKKRLPAGGWSSPIILPENINSPYDEDFPFLNSSGTTFYFSSMGHNSMGGYDIFRCNFNPSSNDFGPISNLDYKINSTDDDILYVVDKENKNAIFSSKRSSKGGMIDVYNVKVHVLPIQNIIISGSFKNSILANDINATIKVQDVRTNKLIGSYNVDNNSNYNILLPNSGKYKFIVETPKSEKIHAGLVEAPAQTELKALKQEIELVKINGVEKLIIKDYFDQSPENEAFIIANILKKMSNPEININLYPDSVLDKLVEVQSEDLLVLNDPNENSKVLTDNSENEIGSFNDKKEQLLSFKNDRLSELKDQSLLVSNIAKNKSEESSLYATKADDILLGIESEENDSIKGIQLKSAAKFNATSKRLSEEVTNAAAISKKIEEEIILKEKEILIISELEVKEDLVADNNDEIEIIKNIKEQLSNPLKEKSTVEIIQQQSIEKEQKANDLLKISEEIKLEKQTIQTQLNQEKLILDSNNDIAKSYDQNLKINELESKIKKLDSEIEGKSLEYDKLISEKKELEIQNDFITTNYIDKNNPQQETKENQTSNSLITSSNNTTSISLSEERKDIEFVENLPIDIPIAKELPEIKSQTINGVTFSAQDEPENYKVSSVPDPDIDFIQDNYENNINNQIIEINIENINKIKLLTAEVDSLKLLKLDLTSEKEIAKIDKEIKKVLKKRAKTELKIADDMAYVNETEINYLLREISSIKKQLSSEDSTNFKFKQAQEYEKAANDLFLESKLLREKSSLGSDTSYFLTEFKIHKVDLIEHANKNENTAIKYLSKSKKLYAESVTEDFSDDKISIAKSLNTNQLKQSDRLEELSEISMNESIEYSEKAILFKEEGNLLKSKDYEDLAEIQKNKSISYKQESLNYKEKESNLVQDIEISNSLIDSQSLETASSDDFKSYYEFQKSIKNLDLESQKLKYKNQSYLKLSEQMNAKADALEQKSKLESDVLVKKELISASTNLRIEAKKNKKLSEAIVYSMDSVKREIKNKQMSQALVIEMLDPSKKNQIKALAISGKADSVLALLSNKPLETIALTDSNSLNLTDSIDFIAIDSSAIDSSAIDSSKIDVIEDKLVQDFKLPEAKPELVFDNSEDIFSKDFVPPIEISQEIFLLTDKKVYSEENPIPLNPRIPKGLIFKVQVGAFRNPIPQDLFQGFAPISAEKMRDDITRYRVGYFKTFLDANQAKNQVRALNNSYRDAFVVAINNGIRIKLSEARNIQQSDPSLIISSSLASNSNLPKDNSLSELRTQIANDSTLATAVTIDQVKGVIYSVQIGAFSKPLTKENAFNISPLFVSKVNNLYKYSAGKFKSIDFALIKKSDLIKDSILPDAFIIAYNNGVKISLDQARSINPDREVVYENPIIYYIDFGTYPVYKTGQFKGEPIPDEDSPDFLNLSKENSALRDLNIKSRSRFSGNQFFSKKFNSLLEAQLALNLIQSPEITNSKILKSTRDNFAFNYEYKIEILNSDTLDDTFGSKLNKLKNLEFKNVGDTIYYSKSRDDYESATTDLNACKSQDLEDSRIIVFKNGVKSNLEQTLKNFK